MSDSSRFVSREYLLDVGPAGFTRAVERFCLHIGFAWAENVDGSGDGGADIVGLWENEKIVVQCKWKKAQPVGQEGVIEAAAAIEKYNAARAVVVTNSDFSSGARDAAARVESQQGKQISLINGADLASSWGRLETFLKQSSPRPYQMQAIEAIQESLKTTKKALLILATGLGKTFIAGNVIAQELRESPTKRVLVLAHTRDLVAQLERALWRNLSKETPTQILDGDSKPDLLSGVTIATHQSAIWYIRKGFVPDLLVVDEAHNVGRDSEYAEILQACAGSLKLGLTATPWRSDGFNISDAFGPPSYQMGLAEGINQGYLSDVRYRMFVDTIDWDQVRSLSKHSYSVNDLNKKLFLTQRDETIRDHLLESWNETPNPRAIVFCGSIEHATKFAEVLNRIPGWSKAAPVHANQSIRERRMTLLNFRSGEVPIITAVDILNEGVDVPDVNIVCFARLTHSRKIFVQQLGRGLRLSRGKTHVEVLDFVTDVRRLKAGMDLASEIRPKASSEVLFLPSRDGVNFEEVRDAKEKFWQWLTEVSDLEDLEDTAVLSLPDI